jgi:hypothetical protein
VYCNRTKHRHCNQTNHLGKIYTVEEIEKAKQSPSFDREYDLKHLGKIGNVLHTKDIEAAIEKGMLYDSEITPANPFAADFGISMGIDPGYGSSSFGIVITQLVDAQLQVLYADEFQRPDFNDMLNVIMDLMNKHQVQKIFIDAANPSFIKALKLQIGDKEDYENQIAYCKKMSGTGLTI